MKRSGIQLTLLIIALLCLSALTVIQINWVVREARLQEQQFNENVKVALQKIEKTLAPFVNRNLSEKFYNSCPKVLYGLQQAIDLDSLISNELRSSGINLDYEYGIVNIKLANYSPPRKGRAVTANLAEGLRESGYQLKINFPRRSDFILAQMGYAFITSIILIILAVVSFSLIFAYFSRERALTHQIWDFVNNMTHEFKTPLTNIAIANNLISKNEKLIDDEKLKSYSNIIRTEQKKLNDRVEQLLSTSMATHYGNEHIELLDISDVADDTAQSFSGTLDRLDGEIHINKSGDNLQIRCNPGNIHIILSNLIDNAIKYTIAKPIINISVYAMEKFVVLEVSDNGIGISRQHQKYIFNNYYRVPTGDLHDTKGFGIGLFHVKHILDSIGGSIKVQSLKNKGSKFTIHIPKYQENHDRDPS